MRHRNVLFIVLLAVLAMACGVKKQRAAINNARIGLAITGVGLEAADKGATEYFEEFPSSDTEKYCQGEITLFILDQVAIGLQGARDSISLWETSLAIYLSKKDAGSESKEDWSDVLTSEADWLQVLVGVIAVLDMGMQFMESAGAKLPSALSYAWGFVYSLAGRPAHGPPDLNWGDLKTGVCAEFLPGGA